MRSARRPKGCWFEAMAATQKTVRLFVKLVESGLSAFGLGSPVSGRSFRRRGRGLRRPPGVDYGLTALER